MVSHYKLNKSPHPFESADKVQNWVRGLSWQANAKTVDKDQHHRKESSSEPSFWNVFKYYSPGFLEKEIGKEGRDIYCKYNRKLKRL